jgi:hypothetical protein
MQSSAVFVVSKVSADGRLQSPDFLFDAILQLR